jgi:hypothetical protein
MTMEKVYQVFVSSTYADLADERRGVSETLAKAGYIPAGMELFPATDQKQLEFIKRVIDRCDYYVVIVGGRYGSLADNKISYTEKEYEYALEKKIPILAFLHKDPEKIESGKTDRNQKQAKKLAAFRERLASGRIVDFWAEPQELCTKVVIAVTQAINLMPGAGWIRGDQAIDPKVLQDLERLRLENANLQRQLSNFEAGGITFPPHLANLDDKFEFTIVADQRGIKSNIRVEETWKRIFLRCGNRIWKEDPEDEISSTLATWTLKSNYPEKHNESAKHNVLGGNLLTIKAHLEALGLIKVTSKGVRPNSYLTWALTEKGRRILSEFLAIKKKGQEPDL